MRKSLLYVMPHQLHEGMLRGVRGKDGSALQKASAALFLRTRKMVHPKSLCQEFDIPERCILLKNREKTINGENVGTVIREEQLWIVVQVG
ncbi:hypothetical protein [Methanoregula sp.]|uniref:hypothetical protein n=1 Tax=Methanoregula sp. TaxID=2052170 RepID=UPI003BB0BD54